MCRAGILVNVVMFAFTCFPLPRAGRAGRIPGRPAADGSRPRCWTGRAPGAFLSCDGGWVSHGAWVNLAVDAPVMNLTYGLLGLAVYPWPCCSNRACSTMSTPARSDRHHHLGHAPPGQLRRRHPAGIAASRASGVESFYFLADYTALESRSTSRPDQTLDAEIAASWIAAGLDPGSRHFLPPSDIPESRITWLLHLRFGKGLLNRAHAYKASVDQETTPAVSTLIPT